MKSVEYMVLAVLILALSIPLINLYSSVAGDIIGEWGSIPMVVYMDMDSVVVSPPASLDLEEVIHWCLRLLSS